MQRMLSILPGICLLLCACALIGNQAPPLEQRLTGDWITSEQQAGTGTVTTRMHIGGDHTFSGSMQVNDSIVWTFAGTWQLSGHDITWHYTDSSLILLEEDRAELDTIVRLEDSELVLQSGRHDDVRTLARTDRH